jgi:hypothetical protein
VQSCHNNSRSAMVLWQIGVITLICVGLTSESMAQTTVRPTSLTYYAVQGGTNPPNKTITVSRTRTRQVTLTSTDNRSWLSVSPENTSMTTSKSLTVAVNTSGRGAGTYTGTITITVGTWYSTTVPVTLIISPATSSPPSTTSSVTLRWNAVTGATVSGYKVYVGDAPRQYTRSITVGNVTSSTVSNLTRGRTYYFAVSAYNSGGEGPTSTEVSRTIP